MREKYTKGYFALARLLVSDFLLFNVSGSQILKSWVPGLESQVLDPGSQVLGPESQVLGPYFRQCHTKQLTFSYSKSTVETVEEGVKYVQS